MFSFDVVMLLFDVVMFSFDVVMLLFDVGMFSFDAVILPIDVSHMTENTNCLGILSCALTNYRMIRTVIRITGCINGEAIQSFICCP